MKDIQILLEAQVLLLGVGLLISIGSLVTLIFIFRSFREAAEYIKLIWIRLEPPLELGLPEPTNNTVSAENSSCPNECSTGLTVQFTFSEQASDNVTGATDVESRG